MAEADRFLELARAGHREAAVDGLLGLGSGAIHLLHEALRSEADPAARDVIVEAAWQLRSPESIELLAEAIDDPDPRVWRQALDGLTALASSASLRALEAARDRRADADEDFATWVDQAIEDVTGRINE